MTRAVRLSVAAAVFVALVLLGHGLMLAAHGVDDDPATWCLAQLVVPAAGCTPPP